MSSSFLFSKTGSDSQTWDNSHVGHLSYRVLLKTRFLCHLVFCRWVTTAVGRLARSLCGRVTIRIYACLAHQVKKIRGRIRTRDWIRKKGLVAGSWRRKF